MRRVIAWALLTFGVALLGSLSCGPDLDLDLRATAAGSRASGGDSGGKSAGNAGAPSNLLGGAAGTSDGTAGASGGPSPGDCATCASCESDDNCADNSTETRCSPTTHLCVECLSDADCRGGRRCDFVVSACATPCSSNVECGDRFCNGDVSLCVECLVDDTCDADVPHCLHDCVECVGNDDCVGELPYCLLQRHRCVACLADPDCTQPDAVCTPSHSCRVPPVDAP